MGQTRTLRSQLEDDYKQKVGPMHIAWPWLVRHAAWVTEMFHIKTTGRTPHQDATGSVYKGTIVKFG